MKLITERVRVSAESHCGIVDITGDVASVLSETGLTDGNVLIFVKGSTGGVTTVEYEPGLLKDLPEFFEKIIPSDVSYQHDKTWGDGNGFSHLRASLLGPSINVPFENGKLLLGTWQQIIIINFDNKSRTREIILQFMGD
ncbi:MAG: YjbQ family protein [candidate division Zixibacteria bacterium]|nr:YjbQ family protein [candidate division Zixibacteria bacterium]